MEKIANDLIRGARGIAEETGMTERQVYHAAEKGHLPIKRIGGVLVALRSELRRAFSSEAA